MSVWGFNIYARCVFPIVITFFGYVFTTYLFDINSLQYAV